MGLLDGTAGTAAAGSLPRRVTGNQRGEGVWGSWLAGAGRTPRPQGKESGTGWGPWGRHAVPSPRVGGWLMCYMCHWNRGGAGKGLSPGWNKVGGREASRVWIRGQFPLAERLCARPCAWPCDLAEVCGEPLAAGSFTLTSTHVCSHSDTRPHTHTRTLMHS